MIGSGRTHVLYESPRRIERLLGELAEVLDDPQVAVGRELTKVHEEVLRGTATEVGTALAEKGPRGEFAVAVYVAESEAVLDDERIEREIAMLLDKGLTVRDVAEFLKERGVSRRVVYDTARRLDSER